MSEALWYPVTIALTLILIGILIFSALKRSLTTGTIQRIDQFLFALFPCALALSLICAIFIEHDLQPRIISIIMAVINGVLTIGYMINDWQERQRKQKAKRRRTA